MLIKSTGLVTRTPESIRSCTDKEIFHFVIFFLFNCPVYEQIPFYSVMKRKVENVKTDMKSQKLTERNSLVAQHSTVVVVQGAQRLAGYTAGDARGRVRVIGGISVRKSKCS